ncbi:MAG TPA: hypothetical protein VFI96_01135 [Longimicrobiaceae bacterium]|nr:hypothetical protein [Longimicrobiaceae bacterium]
MMFPELDADEATLAVLAAPWKQRGDRNYPPFYYYALGRYMASPRDVTRLRNALRGIPRVDPSRYDILFNSLTIEWDVVKWCDLPEPMGYLNGRHAVRTVLEPEPVYSIDAKTRNPSTLGAVDFERLRSLCVSLRGGSVVDAEIDAENERWQADMERELQDREYDLASYYRGVFKQAAEETGIGDLPPEEMARRFGGLPNEWDPENDEE